MNIWQFIQDEILGMKWLNRLIGSILSMLGLDTSGRLGGSVQFFLYDVIKITVLLCFLIFVISYIQSYFPPERSKICSRKFDVLSKQNKRKLPDIRRTVCEYPAVFFSNRSDQKARIDMR